MRSSSSMARSSKNRLPGGVYFDGKVNGIQVYCFGEGATVTICNDKITSVTYDDSKSTKGSRKSRSRKQERRYTRHIPGEVVEEILVRLPVESVTRFKSVSKAWRSLIESRSFIDLYTRHSRTRSPCKYMKIPLELEIMRPLEVYLDEDEDDDDHVERWVWGVHTMGPLSNGISCVVSTFESDDGRFSILTGKTAFCNPTTRDYKLTGCFPASDWGLLSELAVRPCRVRYGFGTTVDRDYKVVVVISWGPLFSSFLSFVYSLQRGGEWTKIVDYEQGQRGSNQEFQYPEITPDLELCPQGFFNGCWHWMGVNPDHSYSVLSFNLANDAFSSFAAPGGYSFDVDDQIDRVYGGWSLVLNDHLAAIFFDCDPCSFIHVWMMMEYGAQDSWTNIYAIQPNFDGSFSRLVGLYCQLDDNKHNIQHLVFQDYHTNRLITCRDSGYVEGGVHDLSLAIYWNTPGITTYIKTLEPLSSPNSKI